jgi:hypothetical protein
MGTPLAALPVLTRRIRMSDNLTNRGPQDRARVNVNEAHEVRYWTQQLGISEAQLREAVKVVGVSADAVKKHVGKQ